MAHKTLIDGTAYNVVGGTTLIDGTSYRISAGKTLIDGTGYSIPLVSSGSTFNWGNDGETVDAQWFSDLNDFLAEAQPEDVANSIPIGGWKTVTLSNTLWGSKTHYISVIGINQDSDVGVTFWDSPSTASYVSGSVQYNQWWTTSSGPQYQCSQWVNYFPGKDYLLTVTKKKYNPTSSSYASSYDVPSFGTVQAWLPSFDELQGDKTPEECGLQSSIRNPAYFGLSESKARYSWPPTQFKLNSNNSAWPVISRTSCVTSSGVSNQQFTCKGLASDPSGYMTMGGSSQYSMGCCFALGRDIPGFLDSLSWSQINDLCVQVQEGGQWPTGLEVGLTKDWEFTSVTLGDHKIKVHLVGIDQDQPGTLTFITDAFSATTVTFGSDPTYITTTSSGARYWCQVFYNSSAAKSYIRPIGRLVNNNNQVGNSAQYYLLGDWAYVPSVVEYGLTYGADQVCTEYPVVDNTQASATDLNLGYIGLPTRQVEYIGMRERDDFLTQSVVFTRSRVPRGGGDYYVYTVNANGTRGSQNCGSRCGYRILFTIGTKYPDQRVYY